jgi:hypothetical protein
MQRTVLATASLLFFAGLALLWRGRAAAGPPERVSGKMQLGSDEVTEGLRRYRKEKDPEKRLALLQTLGATGDPRVALALVDAANCANGDDLDCEAANLMWWYYASPDAAAHRRPVHPYDIHPGRGNGFRPWWQANEAEVRRRASLLPR